MPASRTEAELSGVAREAMDCAYAPYSAFRVGVALEAADGRVFTGCNVENAAYPVTICAEQVALGTAVAAGARQFRRIVVATAAESPTAPCGMCRQALAEFGLDLEIVAVTEAGARDAWSLRELLPERFTLGEIG